MWSGRDDQNERAARSALEPRPELLLITLPLTTSVLACSVLAPTVSPSRALYVSPVIARCSACPSCPAGRRHQQQEVHKGNVIHPSRLER
jgi:hypothetical protein